MAQFDIISPLPGVFYRRPSPDSNAFFEEGDTVESTSIIGLIEVMKQYSELTADTKGTLVRFCVEDSAPIEPGQVIAVVETQE